MQGDPSTAAAVVSSMEEPEEGGTSNATTPLEDDRPLLANTNTTTAAAEHQPEITAGGQERRATSVVENYISGDAAAPLWIDRLQRTCNVISHALSFCSIAVVYWWTQKIGGLSWKAQPFNYHPLLMVVSFCFMTVSALSFRFPYYQCTGACYCGSRSSRKLLHGTAWFVAALAAYVALRAVFRMHNTNTIANLYSLHSWIGCTVILLYVIQFLVGSVAFGCPTSSSLFRSSSSFFLNFNVGAAQRARILRIHTVVGPFIYLAAAATILLGIQEKEGFVGCSYKVDEPDYFPPKHFADIPLACRISHLLGLLIFATALSTTLALHNFKNVHRRAQQQQISPELSDDRATVMRSV